MAWQTNRQVENASAGLIQTIYSSVNSQDAWLTFMRDLVGALDARSARMLFMNPAADKVHNSFAINHDERFMRQYTDHYVNKCPWRPELALKPKGRLYSSYLDFSCRQKAFRQTEFYEDWARPQQIEHGICGTVLQDKEQTVQLLVQRTADIGHFTAEETAAVNRLVPHLHNAINLAGRAEQMQLEQQGVAALANRYSLPFALIDAKLKAVFISSGMEQRIRTSRGLKLGANRVQALDADEHNRLQRLLRESIATAAGHGRSSGGKVDIGADSDDSLALHVLPFPVAAKTGFAPSRGVFAAVLLHCDSLKFSLAGEQLTQQFQLSRRESDLAVHLCQGLSLEQIAARDGVQASTLRKQLKSVYIKTGTHRQGELISVLLNSVAAIRV